MFHKFNITKISKIGFSFLFIIAIINGIILLNFLFKLEDLNNNITISKNTYKSFLKVKNNTERLLTSAYLNETIEEWKKSIKEFNETYKEYKKHFKNIDSNLYLCNKETTKLINILNNNLDFKRLKNKPILQIKGELFNQDKKEDFYSRVTYISDSIEYIIQNQTFILESFEKQDIYQNTIQIKELTYIKQYAIISTILFFIFLLQIGIFTIKIIKQNELTLLKTKEHLKDSVDETLKSKLFIQNILDTVPSRIFWKDKNGIYLGANKLFVNDADLDDVEQLIGKTDWELKWKTEAQSYINDDMEVMNNNKSRLRFEETQTFLDGTIVNIITSKMPLRDTKNKVIGTLGIYDDITEQKRLEKKLNSQNKMIEEQSKMVSMGEMIGNIAHQWRQPLSVISTGATGLIIQKEYNNLSDKDFYETCERINNNAQYLSKTIDDFRNFIKGNTQKELFVLENTINSFLNLVDSSAKNNDIEIVLDLTKDIKLNNYPNELIQCMINIFNNAKDALKEQSNIKRYIFISTYQENKNVYITIKDNAGGIPEKILPRIFEPYFTTKHQAKGTGLGLHMTYNLVVSGMKGNIYSKNTTFSYDNTKYKGAIFTITLPLK